MILLGGPLAEWLEVSHLCVAGKVNYEAKNELLRAYPKSSMNNQAGLSMALDSESGHLGSLSPRGLSDL